MSALYLFRHAQAGPRHAYDTLSELGRAQARSLGEHLAAEKTEFAAVYCGTLERQRLTARAVQQAYVQAQAGFPEIVEDPRWDEFDLSDVYQELAPHLCRDDPAFEVEYERLLSALGDENHDLQRQHSYCDVAVVNAWAEGRYPYEGESWNEFRSRILSVLETLVSHAAGAKVAVFTSASPVGVWVGEALQLDARNTFRLAGVTFNSGITTLRVHSEDVRLFTFNSIPHLSDPAQRTFR